MSSECGLLFKFAQLIYYFRSRQSTRHQRQPYELRSSRSRSSDQQQKINVQTANVEDQDKHQIISRENSTKSKAWNSGVFLSFFFNSVKLISDGAQPSAHQVPLNSSAELKQSLRNSTTAMITRRQSLAKHGNSTTSAPQNLNQQMNCFGMAHNSGTQKVQTTANDQHDRRRTASTAAAIGSQRRS